MSNPVCQTCDNAYVTFILADTDWMHAEPAIEHVGEQFKALRQARNDAKEAWNTSVEAHREGLHV